MKVANNPLNRHEYGRCGEFYVKSNITLILVFTSEWGVNQTN